MATQFGVLIPTREAIMSGRPESGPLLAMAERAEQAGFDSVWIGDSITARPRHEPLTLLAAVAARTRRVAVGTAVLLPALRNPVVLAHVVGTLDRIAEGRTILGVGIAADTPAIRKEFAAAGVPWDRRVGRFLETLEICRALWRGETRDGVSFGGKHFTLQDVTVEPKPHRRGGPPIWIGGSGPTALREAARWDAWFPTGPSVEFFEAEFPKIQAAARTAGRAPGAVTGAAYLTLALDADRAAAEKRLHGFLETYYAAPAKAILARQATYAGPIEGCVEWLQRWVKAGARHLLFRFAGGDQLAQVDEVATKLLPRVQRA
ncbi:MAG: LLM class F420-dependent oxidoreductase [Candidatus Rokuibacteriota bacterium]|nr:MAG: LLM class F420-dependent oxidoreductase [Candidatus Rokubacteria bacterium]